MVLKCFLELPSILVNVIKTDGINNYNAEVQKLLTDAQLCQTLIIINETMWIVCHNALVDLKKKATVFKIITVVFSWFHGHHVESNFSMMGDTMDKKSSRMNIETCVRIQTVKYEVIGMLVIVHYIFF